MMIEDDWVPVADVTIEARVDVRDVPLDLAPAQIGPHQIAYGTAPNIFAGDDHTASPHVIVNLLAEEGALKRASILVPQPGDEPRVLHMRITEDEKESD